MKDEGLLSLRNPDVKDIKNLIPNAPHLHALLPLTLHFGTAIGIEIGFCDPLRPSRFPIP